jgi:hypothetical protein
MVKFIPFLITALAVIMCVTAILAILASDAVVYDGW